MPKVTASAPVLLVADVQAAAAFYRDRLGFTVERFWGDPPSFCMPRRDGLIIMLSQVPADAPVDTEFRTEEDVWSAYFWCDGARALHDEWVARGVTIVYAPCPQPYGILEFSIRDLDGHCLGFGEPI